MRVLFVKLTSMGDVIHALPALSDAVAYIPNLTFDWVVDKNFAEIPTWHPAVKNIITTSHRIWKKKPWEMLIRGEFTQFIKNLRTNHYDLVIDGQASTKSSLVTLLSRGVRCGFDQKSSREWTAHYSYKKKYYVDTNLHAVERIRSLFAQIFYYNHPDTSPSFGIDNFNFTRPEIKLPQSYLCFVHNASWKSKLWPENYWHQLINHAEKTNLSVVLPWGNAEEQKRAQRLALNHANAVVLPHLTLANMAYILKNSQGAICSDTGIAHLATALHIPTITLYGATDPKLIGTQGKFQQQLMATFNCTKCYKIRCRYQRKSHAEAQCMAAITPDEVWERYLANQPIAST